MVWDDKVKKLKGILVLVLLLALLASPVAVLASDISGAKFYGLIQVSNNGTAVTNVSTTCNISTTNLINGGYLNSSANNCAIQSSAGTDLAFQPSVNATYPWCLWVPSMGANSIKTDILYTAESTGGKIRYFPATSGMGTVDNDVSLEPGDNFTIEQSGWVDTALVGGIEDFTTYVEEDVPEKLTVTASTVIGVDVDRDEEIYLYKDKGADFFDALDVDFEIFIDSASEDECYGGMALSNIIGTINDWLDTDELTVVAIQLGVAYRITLFRGKILAADHFVIAADTPYYCTILRAKGNDTVNVEIYTDEARTVLVDTLTVAGYGAVKWRYIYGFVSRNTGDAGRNWDGYIKNLDYKFKALIEKPGVFVTYIASTGNITSAILTTSISATGISSGEHAVKTSSNSAFLGIGIDIGDETSFPAVSSNVVFNAPLWQPVESSSPFASVDASAHVCTVTGALWDSNGRWFDHINDKILVATSTDFDLDSGTIEIWIKTDEDPGTSHDYMIFVGDAEDHISLFVSGNDAYPYLYRRKGDAGQPTIFDNTAINDGAWHHLVGGWDAAGAYLLKDGVSVGVPLAGDQSLNIDATTIVTIGCDFPQTNLAFYGDYIGEIRLYDSKLTTAEGHHNYSSTRWKYIGAHTDDDFDYIYSVASVTDTGDDWAFLQNNVMPYMEYQTITIGGTLRQHIVWEYDTIFYDSSGFDNDATPTFRTTSSDPDVSANMTSFLPVSEAKAPPYVLEEAPAFIEETPAIVSEFATTPPAGTFPLAGVIVVVASATDTPPQLPLVLIAGLTIIGLSLAISSIMRRYGSGTILVKVIVIAGIMGVFVAIGNFGIDFWMIVVFLVIGVALSMASRQLGWQ